MCSLQSWCVPLGALAPKSPKCPHFLTFGFLFHVACPFLGPPSKRYEEGRW